MALSGSAALDLMAASLLVGGDGPVELAAVNAAFENRTGCEWLSRDVAEVDLFVADPLCVFEIAERTITQLFSAAARIADPEALGADSSRAAHSRDLRPG